MWCGGGRFGELEGGVMGRQKLPRGASAKRFGGKKLTGGLIKKKRVRVFNKKEELQALILHGRNREKARSEQGVQLDDGAVSEESLGRGGGGGEH